MSILVLIPVILGAVAVFQPILNRFMLEERGLSFAVWLSSFVLFCVATLLLLVIYFWAERFPDYMRPRFRGPMLWWYVIPGMIGFSLVFFLPLVIRSIGAFPVMMGLLLGQLAASFLYDAFSSDKPFSTARVVGLLLALAGAYLTFRPTE